jgi:hypothetical protein
LDAVIVATVATAAVRRSQCVVRATSGTTETATTTAYPVTRRPTADSDTPKPDARSGSRATGRYSEVTETKQAALSAPSATPSRDGLHVRMCVTIHS